MILGGNLHADLKVLTNVGLEHSLQTFQGILDGEASEVCHQPVGRKEMGVYLLDEK